MKKLFWLLPVLALFAVPAARAQTPSIIYCVQLTQTACASLSDTNPYSGTEGDHAWQFSTKINDNFLFLGPIFGLPNNTLVGNSSGSANGLNYITLGTNLSLSGNVLNATGGGGGGGVTSVGLTGFAGLTVTGSPITASGTFILSTSLSGPLKGTGSGFGDAASTDILGLWTGTCDSSTYMRGDGQCQTPPGTGGGTVNSVGLSAPAFFTVSGSPITNSGTLTLSYSGSALPVANGGTGALTLTGPIKGNGTGAFTPAIAADVYGLWSGSCNSSTYLSGAGACSTPAGTGTVTNTGGALTANDVVLGAGGNDTKVAAGIVTDGTSKITLGVAGTSVGALALNNATSGMVTLQPVTGALGTVTASLPANTGTVAETNLAETFSALQTFGTNISIGGVTAAGATGTTNVAFSNSPTFVTPTLGAATAASINGDSFTAGTWTLNGAAGKTLLFNNSLTLAGTDSTTMTFPGTSQTIAGLSTAQTWAALQKITNADLGLLGTSTGYTLLESALTSTSNNTLTLPTTTTDTLAALGTAETWTAAQTFTNADLLLKGSTSGSMTLEAPAIASTYVMTFPAATDTVDVVGTAQTFTAAKTFTNSDLLLLGSSTGATTFASANAGASNFTLTFPAATDTVADLAGTQTFTNKSIAGSEVNSGTVPCAQIPAETGDVVTSGCAATIQAGAVTLAKQANFAASSLMGNPTGSSAAPSAITLGAGLSFSGTTLVASGGAATSITPGTTTITGATSPCAITNSASTTMACLLYGTTGSSTLVETGSAGQITTNDYLAVTGTALPTQVAGTIGFGGEASLPTLAANGEGDIYLGSTTGGLTQIGKGSTFDHTILNDSGTSVCTVATGTTNWNCTGLQVGGTAVSTATAANPSATVSGTATNGSATTFMRSDAAPALATTAVTPGSYTYSSLTVDANGRLTAASSGAAPATAANPTGTAGPAAVNGAATTFMRSDAAPAVQKASASQFGIVETDGSTITPTAGVISCTTGTVSQLGCLKPDGTTITVSAGVITASGGSATTITPGTTTVSGATAPCLIDNSTGTTMGCAALAQTLSLNSGILGTTAPTRTVTTSSTVASTDMGGVIYSNVTGGGTVTIPAISSTVFASGMSLTVVNYSASTAAISTTPTVNAGGGCVSGTGIPAGDTWELTSNGTTLDCNQTVSSASGTGTVTHTAGALTSNAIVLGNGSADTKVAAGIVTDGTSKVTLGVAGTSVGAVALNNATSGAITISPPTGALGAAAQTLQAASDTFVYRATTDTLSGKTMSGSSNTFSNLALSSLATQAADTVVMNATGGSASPTAVATVSYLIDAGTKFTLGTGTGACATTSTLTGGTAVGSFKCTGTTGASTQIVNLPTTTTGWVCDFHDITTSADTEVLSASSTTSATMSGTVAANDVIYFKCMGF